MFVRMLTGAYAGEVREVKFETGRELVANGRAEKIDTSLLPAPAADPRGSPPVAPLEGPSAPPRPPEASGRARLAPPRLPMKGKRSK